MVAAAPDSRRKGADFNLKEDERIGNAVDKETQNTELGGKERSFTQKKNSTTNMTRSVTLDAINKGGSKQAPIKTLDKVLGTYEISLDAEPEILENGAAVKRNSTTNLEEKSNRDKATPVRKARSFRMSKRNTKLAIIRGIISDAGSHEKTKFMPSSQAPDEQKAAGRVRSGTRLRSGRLLQRSGEAKAVRVPRGAAVKSNSTATLRKTPQEDPGSNNEKEVITDVESAVGRVPSGARLRSGRLLHRSTDVEAKSVRAVRGAAVKSNIIATLRTKPRNAVDKETQNTELGGKEGSFTQKKNSTTNMTRSVTLDAINKGGSKQAPIKTLDKVLGTYEISLDAEPEILENGAAVKRNSTTNLEEKSNRDKATPVRKARSFRMSKRNTKLAIIRGIISDAGSHEKKKFMPSSQAPDEQKAAGRVRSGTRLCSGRLLQRSGEAKAVRVPRGAAVKSNSTATLRKTPQGDDVEKAKSRAPVVMRSGGVFIIYDMRMMRHIGTSNEVPERISWIIKKLKVDGLLKRCKVATLARPVELECARAVHSEPYIAFLEALPNSINEPGAKDFIGSDIEVGDGTREAVFLAAGAVIEACDEVATGKSEAAFAVVRPPGHHAKSAKASGFCFMNNIAIGARHVQTVHNLRKILLVDFDVHHGDGSQDIFLDDDSVLFISVHRTKIFPDSEKGEEIIGEGQGKGYNINVSLEEPLKDDFLLAVWDHVLLPAAKHFEPDFILVSAGFDAATDDPLGKSFVTENCFGKLVSMLMEVNPKLVLVLEGGYDQEAIAKCSSECVRALLGSNRKVEKSGYVLSESTWNKVNLVRNKLKNYVPAFTREIDKEFLDRYMQG